MNKQDGRTRRALDHLVAGELPDFALVECEGCGLEQANRSCFCEAWECVCEHRCLLCGHERARMSARHDEAVGSLRLFTDRLS